jgi:hypothetical protein
MVAEMRGSYRAPSDIMTGSPSGYCSFYTETSKVILA